MDLNNAIITINLITQNKSYDIEVPLDISANELCTAVFQKFLPDLHSDANKYYLKCERPIALLRGERTLRNYGIRDGSVINITGYSE